MLYFCSEESAKVVGSGTAGWVAYQKENKSKKLPKRTAFDNPLIINSLRNAGLTTYAKVPATQENKKLWMKYRAGMDTMVIVAPGGKKLATFFGHTLSQGKLIKTMKSFKQYYAQWKKSQPKKNG